ncbi:MAG: FIST N-terminal domain-containing protein [bacterium]|nr:FIST N-terminal domain-containing protein [bacterium]
MFSTVGYPQPAVLAAVRKSTGGAPLTGCSGEGIIARAIADESNFSVAVMVIRSDELRLKNGLETGLKTDPADVGRRLGEAVQAHGDADAALLFVLGDGLTINFDRFYQGFQKTRAGRPRLPLFGGVSADNWSFKQTYQYHDDQAVSDGVAWALLSGPAHIHSGVNHGCVPIGVKRRVTKAEGNIIYRIDDRPALEVLKEYLLPEEIDNWGKAVINLCLGFRTPAHIEGYDEFMIRFIPSKDDTCGSITIQTEVAEGSEIWMTRRDPEKMANGLSDLSRKIRTDLAGKTPKLVFQFDCCGRGKVILPEPNKLQLLEDLQQQIGPRVPWIGFYTLGEIGPVGNYDCFHNYTAVLTVIS